VASERVASGRGTAVDAARLAALESVKKGDDLSPEVREALKRMCRAVIESPEGREWFTLGILKDLALGIALAPRDRDSELWALGETIADKLVPQLRGPRQRADELLAAAAGLPNVELIERQMSRMSGGIPGDLIPFV